MVSEVFCDALGDNAAESRKAGNEPGQTISIYDGKKMKKFHVAKLLVFITLMYGQYCHAQDSDTASRFYLDVDFGVGRLDINESYLIDDFGEGDKDAILIPTKIGFGMRTPYGFIVEAGGGLYSDIASLGGAFDSISYLEIYVALGYDIEISKSVSIVPKLGAMTWSISSTDGWDVGDDRVEDERTRFSGNDVFAEINLEIMRHRKTSMQFSYRYANVEFGRVKAYRIGFIVNF